MASIEIAPMTNFTVQTNTVRSILAEREIYNNFPIWQRNEVWHSARKTYFIKSLLAGRYVPSLVAHTALDRTDPRIFIIDGRQRLTSILQFVDGSFGLTKRGMYYTDLSEAAKNYLLNYKLTFVVLQETDQNKLRAIYRALQNLTQLTASEKTYSYIGSSAATDLAASILEADYFQSIFTGSRQHHEDFSMALYPLTIERYNCFTSFEHDKVNALASGQFDYDIKSLRERIDENMFYVYYLFNGAQTKAKTSLILMYQAVYLLRKCGFDLDACEEGALTPWFQEVARLTKDEMTGRYNGQLLFLTKKKMQAVLWQREITNIIKQPGLVAHDPQYSAAMAQRIESWLRNQYSCPKCKEYASIDELEEHAFRGGICKSSSSTALELVAI